MYADTASSFRPYRARRPRSPWPARLRRAALLVGALVALSLGFARVAQGEAPSPSEPVQVRAGDTVWAIAAARYPGDDVRARVWQIEQLNHLSGRSLQPGQTILVPTS